MVAVILNLLTSHKPYYQFNPIFDRVDQCGEREAIQSGDFSKINLEKSTFVSYLSISNC